MHFPPGRCYQDKLWSWMSETEQEDFLNTSAQVSTVSNLQARESEPKITFRDINEPEQNYVKLCLFWQQHWMWTGAFCDEWLLSMSLLGGRSSGRWADLLGKSFTNSSTVLVVSGFCRKELCIRMQHLVCWITQDWRQSQWGGSWTGNCLAISSEYLPARGARKLHAWSVGRQIEQEEAGREIFSGNSGGGERQKEPHAPFSRTVVSC